MKTVGITSHAKLTTYLVIRKNRSNDDKRNVSQILGWQTLGIFELESATGKIQPILH